MTLKSVENIINKIGNKLDYALTLRLLKCIGLKLVFIEKNVRGLRICN